MSEHSNVGRLPSVASASFRPRVPGEPRGLVCQVLRRWEDGYKDAIAGFRRRKVASLAYAIGFREGRAVRTKLLERRR
jgi:hypothetical protein